MRDRGGCPPRLRLQSASHAIGGAVGADPNKKKSKVNQIESMELRRINFGEFTQDNRARVIYNANTATPVGSYLVWLKVLREVVECLR